MIAGFPFIASSFDPDARNFVQTSGATDRAAINFFVKGIKRLGLWDDMVCWPLRSAQNAGTGSTAYSLGGLGTYNGTLVNGPTWGAGGTTMLGASSQSMTIGDDAILQRQSEVGLAIVLSTASASNFTGFGGFFSKSPGGAGFLHNYQFQENDGGRVISLSTGDGVSAAINFGASIGSNTNKNFLIGSAKAGDVTKIKHNANAIQSTVNTLAQFNTTSDALQINRSGPTASAAGAFAAGGEYSFAALFATDLADSQMTGFYSLYRSTLGQGLGLP